MADRPHPKPRGAVTADRCRRIDESQGNDAHARPGTTSVARLTSGAFCVRALRWIGAEPVRVALALGAAAVIGYAFAPEREP